MSFKEKWLAAVEKKNSVLCAGLDPAEFNMERGDEGLPKSEPSKRHWAVRYIEAVAPYCAAIKPNIQYWKGRGYMQDEEDMCTLGEICGLSHALGMVVIEDSKLADIGSTNDAGMYYAAKKGMNAITYSPFAGNIKEAVEQAHKRNLGLISMCLMSNPEYEKEKNKLVSIEGESGYDSKDIITMNDVPYAQQSINDVQYVKQYIQLAHDSAKYGLDGIVIGAPSKKNHIKEEEIQKARRYAGDNMLALLPGAGAQGGEASSIWKYFGKDNVIVNVGRALMFPNGQNSSSEDHITAAKQYQDMLNGLRK
jgi:orotidine-5'-phosphate decarboxylase